MEVNCSFKSIVGGCCAHDQKDRNQKKVVVPLVSCRKSVSAHTQALRFRGIESEVDLILARASIFSTPQNISELTICPAHRSSLGISWRRGAERCRVPKELAEHGKRGKWPRAERGMSKDFSKTILQSTGVFVPVGSGKYYSRKSATDWKQFSVEGIY